MRNSVNPIRLTHSLFYLLTPSNIEFTPNKTFVDARPHNLLSKLWVVYNRGAKVEPNIIWKTCLITGKAYLEINHTHTYLHLVNREYGNCHMDYNTLKETVIFAWRSHVVNTWYSFVSRKLKLESITNISNNPYWRLCINYHSFDNKLLTLIVLVHVCETSIEWLVY